MFETIIKCKQPVYTLSDELKKICPKKISKYNAIAVFFIFFVVGIIVYFMMKKDNKKKRDEYDSNNDLYKKHNKRPEKFHNKTVSIISIFMCATLMSIFSFLSTRLGYKSSILKYKNIFDYYESQGITGQAAVDRIELEERSKRRDRAISYSGSRHNSGNDSLGGITFNI
jgi:hypothetical protein